LADARFSAEDFQRRVRDRLAVDPGDPVGDHTFNPDIAEMFEGIERRAAAVLVPIIHREPEATILLTRRTEGLSNHAGQIAFPGGRIDPEDEDAVAAALREAEEEVGLSRDYVETLCLAPEYFTASGFRVAPVIAIVKPGFTLVPNPAEVDSVFEVPLSFLMDPANHRRNSRVWQGVTRYFFEMPYQERYIWGITAGILRILYERLYHDEPETVAS
jgi:8-oxo-dGTP pyrophosphatase MutT (NUDIX family)